jgi:hypothetical protein
MHMPRAAGCFRAVGLTFDTLAVEMRSGFAVIRSEAKDPMAALTTPIEA